MGDTGDSGKTEPSKSARIMQLDTMRAIAVLLVFTHHVLQGFTNKQRVLLLATEAVDLGRVGIVVFFLISGFVIARAIPGRTLAATSLFWTRRFWRLFPAYWVAVAIASALSIFGIPKVSVLASHVTLPSSLANLTMIPHLFGEPMAIGVFWTLEVELVFYALISLVVLARRPSLRTYIACAFLMFVLSIGYAGAVTLLHLGDDLSTDLVYLNVLHLSIMFGGAALRLHWDDRNGDPDRLVATMPPELKLYFMSFTAFLLAYTVMKVRAGLDIHSFRAVGSYTLGFAIFLLGIERLRYSSLGKFIGDRSYSFYLLHIPVIAVTYAAGVNAGTWAPNPVAFVLLTLTLSLLLSMAMFKTIEQPFNRFGHVLSKRQARYRIDVAERAPEHS
jgi:peptidoglycan/LPS O-acetylase OafA/YrhL